MGGDGVPILITRVAWVVTGWRKRRKKAGTTSKKTQRPRFERSRRPDEEGDGDVGQKRHLINKSLAGLMVRSSGTICSAALIPESKDGESETGGRRKGGSGRKEECESGRDELLQAET